jgi:hypothetical protein
LHLRLDRDIRGLRTIHVTRFLELSAKLVTERVTDAESLQPTASFRKIREAVEE